MKRSPFHDPTHRNTPAPVPPHPRKRPVVGQRVYGVDECRTCATAVPRALPAPHAIRSGILRPAPRRGKGGPGGSRAAIWNLRILLLSLLVQRHTIARTSAGRYAQDRNARFPIHALLGQ